MLRTLSVVLGTLCLLSAFPAAAGHYDLADASFITPEDASLLVKAGIPDTEALLNASLTPEARKALAAKSSVAQASLDRYVQLCDLLRIEGVGPGMAQLFNLAGIASVTALKAAAPLPLHKKLLELNDAKHVMGVVPQVETLTVWIERAGALPAIVK